MYRLCSTAQTIWNCTNDPLHHQQYCHAAGAALMPCLAQGLVCPLCAAAKGDVDHRAAQHTLPTPHHLALLTSLAPYTHSRPPGPSRGGDQALLDRGIHQLHLIP
jgi:hypothetical protein